ncbi:calmodulin-lysine N-methyltransferase-like [Tetranychus urticae]|uniref:Calmodulin-lysine N-methyltransferase n=1 Tax=Tetranychus urticae TaxID=32264 RepID=T1KA11_TETUR|nr:calmodulin-lysine N-methyltransferase-like [Tetranychus urticae]
MAMMKTDPNTDSKQQQIEIGLRRTLARARWQILAKVFYEGLEAAAPYDGSIRLFNGFPLITLVAVEKEPGKPNGEESNVWYQATCQGSNDVKVEIRLPAGKIPFAEILISRDSTGAICIWPSEKILGYWCLQNKPLFNGKVVLELGSGLTGLSGLIVASTCNPAQLFLTDGNPACIDNLNLILARNRSRFISKDIPIEARQLTWGQQEDYENLSGFIDVILISDCLYLENCHKNLEQTIWSLLKRNGKCYIIAPSRNKSFEKFANLASKRFIVQHEENYDPTIWSMHTTYLDERDKYQYSPDRHYPLLMILTKPSY